MNKLKRYWLFQFIGWGVVALLQTFFSLMYDNLSNEYFFRLAIIIGLGLFCSHLIKVTIVKSGVFKKGTFFQFVAVTLITIFYTMVGGALYFLVAKSFNILSQAQLQFSAFLVILIWAFNFGIFLSIWVCFYFIYHYVEDIRRAGQEKLEARESLLELEAKALRAQMNPHFIFNCLNSIKSLIQEDKKEISISYLTTFSKLIRTLFNNADKKEISLYDEIETCKLYLKLESMRFDEKFSYNVVIDPSLDLKSIQVPALIIQPFIENAIIHGIIPKEADGSLQISVVKDGDSTNIIIDDNGIGREASVQNKSLIGLVHQSKGVFLTQSRLLLNNLITKRQAAMEIIDKKSKTGAAEGTRAILSFKNQLV